MYWQNTTVIKVGGSHVSFPEKLLKIVATRGEIFSLKFTKYRLAAAPPDSLATIRGPTSKGRGGKGRGGEGRGGEGRGREGGREGRMSPYQSTFASRAHAFTCFHSLHFGYAYPMAYRYA